MTKDSTKPDAIEAGSDGMMPDDAIATMKLGRYQKQGRKLPIIHVLLSDGRATEFKDRGLIMFDEETHRGDDTVVALLMVLGADGSLLPAIKPNGQPAIVTVPVLGVGMGSNPDHHLSYEDVSKRMRVSLSTTKRLVRDGRLPRPVKVGKRKVAFRQGDVDAALASLRLAQGID